MSVPQIFGLMRPNDFAVTVRKFPRSLPAGIFLMLLGTAWFVWNVNVEPIADFSAFKPHMMAGFAVVGILSCVFVRDFLAVRGLLTLSFQPRLAHQRSSAVPATDPRTRQANARGR